MGLKLVKRAFATFATVKVSADARNVLIWMALTARDDDDPPRYFARREETCYALGRMVPDAPAPDAPDREQIARERAAAFQRLKVVIGELVAAGLLERVKRGQRNQRAEYALTFHSPTVAGTPDVPQSSTPDVPHESTSDVPLAVRHTYPQGELGITRNTEQEQPPVVRAPHLPSVDRRGAA